MTTKKDFGKMMRTQRNELELTQVDIACITGISQNYISQYEAGLIFPGWDRLCLILAALKMDFEIYPAKENYPEEEGEG